MDNESQKPTASQAVHQLDKVISSSITESNRSLLSVFSETEKFNSDIALDLQSLNSHGRQLIELMTAQELVTAFQEQEQTAVKNKWIYNKLGFTALSTLMITLLVASAKLTLLAFPNYVSWVPAWFERTTSYIGLVPVLCLVAMMVGGFHKKWLLARYRAERLRHWLYQQLLDGEYVENSIKRTDIYTGHWRKQAA